jgi:hypothetical protein
MSVKKVRGVSIYSPDLLPDGSYSNAADEWARATGGSYQTGSNGQIYASPHQNWLLKAMPYLVMGGMGAGALAGVGAFGGAAAAGAGGGAAAGGAGAAAGAGGMSLGQMALMGLAPAGVNAVTGVVGASKQLSANRAALDEQQREFETTQRYLQAQADEDRRRYEQEQTAKKAAWDAYQTNRQPYRDASLAALAGYRPTPYVGPSGSLADLAHVRRAA